MPKFKVTFSYTETVETPFTETVTVEAADEDAACETVIDENKNNYDNLDIDDCTEVE